MREDTHTNTEADAGAHEAIRGRTEHIGDGGPGDQSPSPWFDRPLGPDPWAP